MPEYKLSDSPVFALPPDVSLSAFLTCLREATVACVESFGGDVTIAWALEEAGKSFEDQFKELVHPLVEAITKARLSEEKIERLIQAIMDEANDAPPS